MQVRLVRADRWIGERRATMLDGRRLYAPQDIYRQADLAAYPSEYEGIGNAFLEAVYYGCPILCKRLAVRRSYLRTQVAVAFCL